MMENQIILTNIQRFSLHDGPGIRTTVFLKGCPIRCPWCSNPENLSSSIQQYAKNGVMGIYGKYYTVEELYNEVIKDKPFYIGKLKEYNIDKSDDLEHLPGGITFSGGESLLQIEQLEPLLARLNSERIHTAVETCLFVPILNLQSAIKYIDLFYVDIKILDEKECQKQVHGELSSYLHNLDVLMYSGKPVVIRIPVIGGYTNTKDNRRKTADLINKYVISEGVHLLKIELIKEHNLGVSKYQSLSACNRGYNAPEYNGVLDEEMEIYKKEIQTKTNNRIQVEICKI